MRRPVYRPDRDAEEPVYYAPVFLFMTAASILEALGGVYTSPRARPKDDWPITLLALFQVAVLIKPAIIVFVAWALDRLLPGSAGWLGDVPLWIALPALLVVDEGIHYWYHRKGHEWEWLWRFHRMHHTLPEMTVWGGLRDHGLWFVMMPNLWLVAVALHLGLVEACVIEATFITLVNFATHFGLRWDLKLYRVPWLRPVRWVVERTITLPDTHHAHHGIGEHANERGNYSTVCFFYDVLFGTAKFPHHEQEAFGIAPDPKDPWYVELYWPIVTSTRPGTELATRSFGPVAPPAPVPQARAGARDAHGPDGRRMSGPADASPLDRPVESLADASTERRSSDERR